YDATGAFVSIEAVDGVPAGGTPIGRASGFRGGVTDPGPKVGRYTSVAVDGTGNPIIAYYDIDNADLKFAAFDGSRWQIHTVESTGDVGKYAHLVVGPAGKPAVVYFMQDSGHNDRQRGLKIARAKNGAPRAASDWDIVLVDAATLPAAAGPPCGGCPSGQV